MKKCGTSKRKMKQRNICPHGGKHKLVNIGDGFCDLYSKCEKCGQKFGLED